MNPLGVRGGLVYGTIAEEVLDRLNAPDAIRGAVTSALMAPSPVLMPVMALVGADLYNPVNAGEDEELRKAQEQDRILLAQGIQPGDGVKPVIAPSATQPPQADLEKALRRRYQEAKQASQANYQEKLRKARADFNETASRAFPGRFVDAGGNPPNEVEAVKRDAISAMERAMMEAGPIGGYESFESRRLGDAIRGAQEDILRRRFDQ